MFLDLGDVSPDGLCVANDGRLLVALYGDGAVSAHADNGNLLDRIGLPVPNITSCVFRGLDQKTLFVTTAWDGLDELERQKYPLSG